MKFQNYKNCLKAEQFEKELKRLEGNTYHVERSREKQENFFKDDKIISRI